VRPIVTRPDDQTFPDWHMEMSRLCCF